MNGPISGISTVGNKTFVITSVGDKSEVYTVDTATGATVDYGPLPVGETGKNPGNLTYDPLTGNLYSTDLVTHQLFIVSQVNRVRHLSIFQLYVSQSDSTGQIVTSKINPKTGAFLPFDPGIDELRVINAQSGVLNLIQAPANSGDSFIGARTRIVDPAVQNVDKIPVLSATITDVFGSAPYLTGDIIRSGVVSAPGTTIGQIQVGGTVMGTVDLHGNIDTFYANWLITGDGNGTFLHTVAFPGNFTVDGDIRNLITEFSVGTDTDAALLNPTYVTGFDMHVNGTLGQFHTFDSLIGNVNTHQSPTAQNLTTAIKQTEVDPASPATAWSGGVLTGLPLFRNETFQTPQYVGSIPATIDGTPSVTVISGTLYADPVNQDFSNYFAVGLLAGQTITCQVTTTPPGQPVDLGVFNPDGTIDRLRLQ